MAKEPHKKAITLKCSCYVPDNGGFVERSGDFEIKLKNTSGKGVILVYGYTFTDALDTRCIKENCDGDVRPREEHGILEFQCQRCLSIYPRKEYIE